MAPHSSTLAWKIPWKEEPGRLQSMGSPRVRHDWVTSLSLFTLCIGEGNGNPLLCSCLENPRDGGAWWAAVYGVTQSRTRLKWLSSSSRSVPIPSGYITSTKLTSGLPICISYNQSIIVSFLKTRISFSHLMTSWKWVEFRAQLPLQLLCSAEKPRN